MEIAVVGGGIAGLGVAERALRHGLSVVLYEKGALACGTSANSLRIIHGGIRYLQHLNFQRVLDSAAAQGELLRDFPDLMRPLRCIMPLQQSGMKSAVPMQIGAALYSLVNRRNHALLPKPQVLNADRLDSALEPLAPHLPWGVFQWFDVLLDDHDALIQKLKNTITEQGGIIHEHCPVQSVERSGSTFRVKADRGESSAAVIIDARGPWFNRPPLFPSEQAPSSISRGRWCKAFNVIVSRPVIPDLAIGVQTSEHRLFFLVPRKNYSVLGTWYSAYDGDPHNVEVSPSESAHFIAHWNQAFPALQIETSNIVGTEAGVLPMKELGRHGPVLVGKEEIMDQKGYIQILSTKYTTFRRQADRALQIAKPYLARQI